MNVLDEFTTDDDFINTVDQSKQRGFATLAEQVGALRLYAANPIQRVPTGLRLLDKAIVGVGMGEMLMFAARAGSGKSAFATQFIANNPTVPSIFFSLEMPANRAIQRLWSQVTGQAASDLERLVLANKLPPDMESLNEKLPYAVVIDKPGLRWQDMASYIDSYSEHFETKPKVIVIDYLELVGGLKSAGEVSAETVAAVANQAKEFAVEHDLGVVLLHQLNNSVKEWEPPNKGSLRYGGLPESDFVIGMWRPGTDPDLDDNAARKREREVCINVIKNRIFGEEPRHLVYTLTESLRFSEPLRLY